jgi:hypothetical protein
VPRISNCFASLEEIPVSIAIATSGRSLRAATFGAEVGRADVEVLVLPQETDRNYAREAVAPGVGQPDRLRGAQEFSGTVIV